MAFMCVCVGVMMSDEHTDAWGSRTCSNGVSEVLAGEAGLIAELFLNPETGRLHLVQSLIYVFFNVG